MQLHSAHRLSLKVLAAACLMIGACTAPGSNTVIRAPAVVAREHHTFGPFPAVPQQPAFSPDSQVLATSSADGSILLWRVSDRTPLQTVNHPGGVTSIAFSPDGQWLVSGGYDHEVRIWRVNGGGLVRTLVGHGATVWSVAFSPDGLRLATSGEDKTVRLWRVSDGALLRVLAGHSLNVWSVAFSPDGQRLASGSFDRTIRVWLADAGTPIRTLTGHTQAVVSVAFSPGGEWLASGGDDSTVRMWRVRDWVQERTLTGGSNHVYSVALSPDGRWLASAGRAKGALGTLWRQLAGPRFSGAHGTTIRLWRVSDGALQDLLAEHSFDVRSVAFSGDGRWLASASEDMTVKLWEIDPAGAR